MKKKIVESVAVAGFAALLTIAATTMNKSEYDKADSADEAMAVALVTEDEEFGAGQTLLSANMMNSSAWEFDVSAQGTTVSGGDAGTVDYTVSGGDMEAAENTENVEPESEVTDEEQEESEYADLALAKVSKYVNVRSMASTDGAILGKIYDGAVAQVLDIVGEGEDAWFHIISGSVEGYVKAEYFLYGDAAAEAIEDYVTRYAVITATRLNVRKEADVSSKRIGYADRGEKLLLLEDLGDWLKVQYTDSKVGYISSEYAFTQEEFVYAKSIEEEKAEKAAEKARREREEAERAAREQENAGTEGNGEDASTAEDTTVVLPPSGEYGTTSELRQAIVDYAMQFLGNKYVHGGNSLETGTDCSGFTSLIYAVFGYSIGRTPSGQLSSAGTATDTANMKPGDIICYGNGKKCTHVAFYIGDGQIIHEANSRKGVIISGTDFGTIMGVRNVIGD